LSKDKDECWQLLLQTLQQKGFTIPPQNANLVAVTATTANHLRGNLWRKTSFGVLAIADIAATRPNLARKSQNCLC
jgi:hypothetical protein